MERRPVLVHSPSCNFPRENKSASPLVRFWHENGGLPRRRKISVDELAVKPPITLMTTVQETQMDSPTIPGRLPVHERSNSAPGTSWYQDPFEDAVLAPITQPFILPSARFGGVAKPVSTEDDCSKSKKRASSMVLPSGVSSAIVPTAAEKSPLSSTPKDDHVEDDAPPAVPPKSPRMVLRVDPHSTKQTKDVASSPQKKLGSAIHLPLPAVSSAKAIISPNPFTNPWTNASTQQKRPNTSEGRASPISRTATPGRSPSRRPSRHRKNVSNGSNRSPTDTSSRENKETYHQHKREASETSILDRARPTKRVEGIVKRSLTKRRPSADDLLIQELPSGIATKEASTKLAQEELDGIVLQANYQAERFEILNPKDVKKLSRELRSLDERCEYLRKTYKSLRTGRRNLHNRMISYLRSPLMSVFSRENILKQEVALAELDASIDEWNSKWELAENRRSRVRQKLLEHIAAASTLQQPSARQNAPEPQTPPRSPEEAQSPVAMDNMKSPQTANRNDVESIKIYADSEVWALLADIEQEMELMARPGSAKRDQQQHEENVPPTTN